MITLTELKNLKEDDGMTLENGKKVFHTNGYQVATEGIETTSPRIALKTIKEWNGTAGVWFSKNVFYIDKSHYVSDLTEAVEIGKKHNQLAIFSWETMSSISLAEM